MRRSLALALPFILLLSACRASVVPEAGALPADARVIALEARAKEFVPPVIRARRGEKTLVQITSFEGDHTFHSITLPIPFEPLPEGRQVLVSIPTDEAGAFWFDSGPIDPEMTGMIVIE